MPKGESGRIVVEIEPALKRKLYSLLAIENLTLKDWFINQASDYVNDKKSPSNHKSQNRGAGK